MHVIVFKGLFRPKSQVVGNRLNPNETSRFKVEPKTFLPQGLEYSNPFIRTFYSRPKLPSLVIALRIYRTINETTHIPTLETRRRKPKTPSHTHICRREDVLPSPFPFPLYLY